MYKGGHRRLMAIGVRVPRHVVVRVLPAAPGPYAM